MAPKPWMRIVDSTLRDGMHAVSHQFTPAIMGEIARALAGAGVDTIEVSHRDGLNGSSFQYGFATASDEAYLLAVSKVLTRAKLAVLLVPPYVWYSESAYGKGGRPLSSKIPPINPAIRMAIHNYAWTGYPSAFFSEHVPTLVVGKTQAELMRNDPQNIYYMNYAATVDRLSASMHLAKKLVGTENLLIFDGAVGGLNVSEPLAALLENRAPAVSRLVDTTLLASG